MSSSKDTAGAPPTSTSSTPFWKNLVAGGTAGIAEVLCMYPTDVAKTRQQLDSGKSVGMLKIFREIIEKEGFHNLYRGIASPILAEAPKRAMKFTLNDVFKGMVKREDGSLPASRAALAGALAGMSECSVNVPFEVIKVSLQSKDNLGRYSGVWDCATSLVKSEGPLALYKGIESQLFRNAVWNGTYFGLIGFLKEDLLAPPSGANPLPYNFGAGVIGGTIATVFNTPFDVCKSRMQNQLKLPGKPLKYVWTLPSLATIISEEGFGAIYKGLGPRLVRLGPGGGVMLMVFTKMQELLAPY